MQRPTLLALALSLGPWGGGDDAPAGEPLAPAQDLAIVAHPADDLLFMQPELATAVAAGTGVTIVYVTSDAHAAARLDGLQAAYATLAGDASWSCGELALAGATVQHCRLAAAKLSLVTLGYPDGGGDGSVPNSLLQLWE